MLARGITYHAVLEPKKRTNGKIKLAIYDKIINNFSLFVGFSWMSVISFEKTRTVSFRNEQLSCTFLKIDSFDINKVTSELNKLTASAPNLLNSLPLILDCNPNENHDAIETNNFFQELKSLNLNIVGIVDNNLCRLREFPWPIINNCRKEKKKSIANLKTKVIEYRVRSGEIIEAADAHLIIIGGVGSGAEIYATGNIYVYGSLQGRAFAGMSGSEDAFIIAQKIDAEMLAIAGIYSLNDEECNDYSGNLKVYLEDGCLNFKKLK